MAFTDTLANLYERIWGYRSAAFEPKLGKVVGYQDRDPERVQVGAVAGSPYYANDPITGLEYYMPITVTYPESNAKGAALKQYKLSHPVFSIMGKKTIIETPLVERNGTFKEMIGIDDYIIRIRGFVVNGTNEYPEAETNIVRDIFEINKSIGMRNPKIDQHLMRPYRNGSDQVVVKELEWKENPGVKNVCPYEIICVSDLPFSLKTIK